MRLNAAFQIMSGILADGNPITVLDILQNPQASTVANCVINVLTTVQVNNKRSPETTKCRDYRIHFIGILCSY